MTVVTNNSAFPSVHSTSVLTSAEQKSNPDALQPESIGNKRPNFASDFKNYGPMKFTDSKRFIDHPDFTPGDLKSFIDGTEAGFQTYVSEFEESLFALSVFDYVNQPDSKSVQAAYANFADDEMPGSALISRDGRTLGIIYEDGAVNFHYDFKDQVQNLKASSWQELAEKAAKMLNAEIELSPASLSVLVTA